MKEMSDSWQSLIRYAKTKKSKASTLKATLKKQDTLLKHQCNLEQGGDSDHVSGLNCAHMMISRGTLTTERVGVNTLVFLA